MISWYFFDDPFKQFYHLTTAFRLDHNDDKYHKTRNTGYLIVITQIPKETSTINNNCNGKYNENIEKKRENKTKRTSFVSLFVCAGWLRYNKCCDRCNYRNRTGAEYLLNSDIKITSWNMLIFENLPIRSS